jgi:hypothetical protein
VVAVPNRVAGRTVALGAVVAVPLVVVPIAVGSAADSSQVAAALAAVVIASARLGGRVVVANDALLPPWLSSLLTHYARAAGDPTPFNRRTYRQERCFSGPRTYVYGRPNAANRYGLGTEPTIRP